ncbi:MAG TPA: DUF507 family protein [Nitrospirae bacterium]|nr:DUF507 family protein [Nitrospirota bacterium]
MRIPKTWVSILAKEIIEGLSEKKLIGLKTSKDEVISSTDSLILDELMVEDRLNKEVRDLLQQYDSQIEKGQLDFQKRFDLTKRKLIRERNIIL